MAILYVLFGIVILFTGMYISDLFTESVDKAFKKKEKATDAPSQSR